MAGGHRKDLRSLLVLISNVTSALCQRSSSSSLFLVWGCFSSEVPCSSDVYIGYFCWSAFQTLVHLLAAAPFHASIFSCLWACARSGRFLYSTQVLFPDSTSLITLGTRLDSNSVGVGALLCPFSFLNSHLSVLIGFSKSCTMSEKQSLFSDLLFRF